MLKDKVVVVTGGGGLLGARFCREIARQGGIAIVADVNQAAAEAIAADIHASGGRAAALALDITSTESVEQLIRATASEQGRIDAVVNNAYPRNRHWGAKLEDVSYESFCENLGLHLGGYFMVAQRFALHFRAQGGGNIVNMGSIYATLAPRFEVYAGTSMTTPVEYAAIKAGVVQLTRYFAQYFKGDGIRCNALSPGGIRDGQPAGFLAEYDSHCGKRGMLEPGDILGALVFLLSDGSQYMTGQNLVVDDGFTL